MFSGPRSVWSCLRHFCLVMIVSASGADAAALFRNAEASLKRAKETGDRFLFYAPHINARVAEQVELEARLRQAVEKRELFLHYQPKVSMETNQIVGVEALMRWRGPDNLLMSPARFVPVLEETGMILEAGRQALEKGRERLVDAHAPGLRARTNALMDRPSMSAATPASVSVAGSQDVVRPSTTWGAACP